MDFEEGLKLVSIRAHAMQKACEMNPGAMAAVLALPADKIEAICSEVTSEGVHGVVIAANYNCEGQVVISGDKTAVDEASRRLKEAGARRTLPLPVGGAFHSPLMEPARAELATGIEKAVIRTPKCPIYQNVTALPSTDPQEIKKNLLAQLTAPVRWTQSVLNMLKDGAGHFVETGPGKVLQGLVAKTAKGDIIIEGIDTTL
jgi:[acyl-carrier-protein] S-malonyltransferase